MAPMGSHAAPLPARRGRYGVDAPYVPIALGAVGVVLLAVGLGLVVAGVGPWAVAPVLAGLFFLASTGSFLYTTLAGKFAVWERLLRDGGIRPDDRLLDMGCGRGAVLLMAAALLPAGRAVGLDLWKSSDQSGNSAATTLENAAAEGVGDRVDIQTGDMRAMPFTSDAFDVVVSSLAIHNITPAAGRAAAIDEAVRVLKPGGRLLIADLSVTREYVSRLRDRGMERVESRDLGWRFWYGGPWGGVTLVSARKPAA
jgi:SAM-dependent methyltransferase